MDRSIAMELANPRPSKMTHRPKESRALTVLALRLTTRLAASGSNLVYSPVSLYSGLAQVAAGARGRALDALLTVLGAGSSYELHEYVRARALADQTPCGGPLVKFATGVWHHAGRPAYQDSAAFAAASTYYYDCKAAATRAVDFRNEPDAARDQINGWAAEATDNFVGSLLPPGFNLDGAAVVLAAAIYFTGKWTTPFEAGGTAAEKFYLLDGTAVDAPLMRTAAGQSRCIAVHNGFKVLKLPYRTHDPTERKSIPNLRRRHWAAAGGGGGNPLDPVPLYSMVIFLPDARDGLWGLVDMITSSSSPVEFLRLRQPETSVAVGKLRLPKFKLSYAAELSGVLRDMGLEPTFNPGKADDDEAEMAALEYVFHKAVIEVNEEGNAPLAPCRVKKGACGGDADPPETVDFVADHPFAFFVMEEITGAVALAGLMLDPSQGV